VKYDRGLVGPGQGDIKEPKKANPETPTAAGVLALGGLITGRPSLHWRVLYRETPIPLEGPMQSHGAQYDRGALVGLKQSAFKPSSDQP